MMLPRSPVLLVAVVPACVAAARDPRPGASPAGTYRVAVCTIGPCAPGDSARALVLGYLVLTDAPLDTAALPDSARRLLAGSFLRGAANGCYVLGRGGAPGETYAGAGRVAATRWRADPGEPGVLRFVLYRSPDASHEVRAALTPDGLRGRGVSRGAGVAAVTWAPDTVVALRVGPPDLARCARASTRRWREIRAGVPGA
jgi:hypothetical protein